MKRATSPLFHHSILEVKGLSGFTQELEGTKGNMKKHNKSPEFQGFAPKVGKSLSIVSWRLHGDSNPGYSRERGLPKLLISQTYDATSPIVHHSSKRTVCFCPDCLNGWQWAS